MNENYSKRFVCSNCGKTEDIKMYEFSQYVFCSSCHCMMEHISALSDNGEVIPSDLGDDGDDISPEDVDNFMKDAINKSLDVDGNKVTWELIEQCPDPKSRLKYRKFFQELGGITPPKEK